MKPLSDTRPEINALLYRLLRRASPAHKLTMLGQMNQTVKTLAFSGVHSRYPMDSPAMLRRRLASLILGPEIANQAYGPLTEKD